MWEEGQEKEKEGKKPGKQAVGTQAVSALRPGDRVPKYWSLAKYTLKKSVLLAGDQVQSILTYP